MASITDINDADLISASNEVINTNFDNLNTDKIETSTLDTDTTLAANSDSKIATQKAVKAYVDTFTSPLASTTAKGVVEEATDAQIVAGTDTGETGARLFPVPSKLNTQITSLLTSTLASRVPFHYQRIGVTPLTTSGVINSNAANSDGSVLIIYSNQSTEIFRYARDTNTGTYYQTHQVNSTIGSSNFSSVVIVGNYVYIFWDSNTVVSAYRYDLADLANEAAMTVPSIDTSGANYAISSWTDGTDIYLAQAKASTTGYKLSISGTTLTTVTTSTTAVGLASNGTLSFMFDGTNTYSVQVGADSITIKKATDIYFVASTTTTITAGIESGAVPYSISIPISNNRMYVGYWNDEYNASAQTKVVMVLTPYTKP